MRIQTGQRTDGHWLWQKSIATSKTTSLAVAWQKLPALIMISHDIPASVKKQPPEKKTLGTFSLNNTKSGAAEQFLPQDCRSKAAIKKECISPDTSTMHNAITRIMSHTMPYNKRTPLFGAQPSEIRPIADLKDIRVCLMRA